MISQNLVIALALIFIGIVFLIGVAFLLTALRSYWQSRPYSQRPPIPSRSSQRQPSRAYHEPQTAPVHRPPPPRTRPRPDQEQPVTSQNLAPPVRGETPLDGTVNIHVNSNNRKKSTGMLNPRSLPDYSEEDDSSITTVRRKKK